jgi:poly(3-hydroxybutyrate) depolymerase
VNREWTSVLDKHHLIWISANRAGNSRSVMVRLGLALDAAANMKTRYSIDPDRIYVAGGSGGGRCASMLGVSCPDVFHGGVYIIGCDYFREIPTGEPNKIWPRSYSQPSPRLLGFAKQRSRHVLLTGEQDMNRPQTKANFEQGFRRDGFEHVEYLEVPGMGHRLPPADWIEKAVQFLDDPKK